MGDPLFIGLGGTDEVGASSYLYLLHDGPLLIDAGVRPGRIGADALPQLELLSEHPPAAMVLTHAHLDHLGALPLVTTRFPKLPVYCTAATARVAALVLADTLKVSTEQGAPLFTLAELQRALQRLRVVAPFEPVGAHGFTLRLIPSGHLIGAVSVLIESGGRRIFHTGDVSNVATPVVDAAFMPPTPVPVDAVVSESTYGDTLLPARKEQVRTFLAAIGETLRQGGQVLIPSFALGRAQEVTQLLMTAMASGLVPTAPLVLDGLTRGLTELYEAMPEAWPAALRNRRRAGGPSVFLGAPVQLVQDAAERERVIRGRRPAVVIASSGMLHAGASPQYARAWLPEAGNALFVVGYQDAESPGRRLLELRQGGEVLLPDGRGGRVAVPASARVERFYLSAHADRGGLLGLLGRYPAGKVVLTHGEVGPRHSLASFLDTRVEVALPAAGEPVALRDGGRRRGAFINDTPRKLAATKEQHARGKVTLRYDPVTHELRVALPRQLDGALFGEGTYTLEVLRGKLSRVKLNQRDPDTELGAQTAEEPASPA